MVSTWTSPVATPPRRVALFGDTTMTTDRYNNRPLTTDSTSSAAVAAVASTASISAAATSAPSSSSSSATKKEDLPSWKAKRDRWLGSPRPKLKPLPSSGGVDSKLTTTYTIATTKTTAAAPIPAFGSLSLSSSRGRKLPTSTSSTIASTTTTSTTTKPIAATFSSTPNATPKLPTTNPFGSFNLVASSSPKALAAKGLFRTTNSNSNSNNAPTNTNTNTNTNTCTTTRINPFGNINLVASTIPIVPTPTITKPTTTSFSSSSVPSSSYPPMSATGPKNPFGSSSKPPTPISATPIIATPIIAAAAAAVPRTKTVKAFAVPSASASTSTHPKRSSAPVLPTTKNPFGSIHLVAPTPSSASSKSVKPGVATTKLPTTTKNPFGSITLVAPTSSSSNPSKPGVAKNPFGGIHLVAPTSSSASSKQQPLVTNAPPKPKVVTKEAPKHPFGSINLVAAAAAATTTPTAAVAAPASKKDSATTSSASSSYPPMSSKAPKNPFGTTIAAKNSAATKAVAVASLSSSASSSYPPMSSAAPKNPFGSTIAAKSSAATKSVAVASSSAAAASASSSYPPMSSAAPKNPFGSTIAAKSLAATKAVAVASSSAAASASSSYPPMSSAAPKNPFGKAGKTAKPVLSTTATTLAPTNSTNPFGIGTSSASKASPFGSPFPSNTSSASTTQPTVGGGSSFGAFGFAPAPATQPMGEKSGNKDYRTRLIKFYETHNASKVGTVDATLEKYKGKEDELFRKIEAKYAAPQPTTPQFPPPAGTGPRCYLEFSIGNEQPARRVVVKLYKDKAPLAAENFRCLCTGEITTHRAAGKPLRYLGSKVHRIVPGFCLQAGDFTTGNGRGGASIYPPNSEHGDSWGKFKDEPTGFLNHSKKGLLSMANSGKNTNSSQFFFTLKAVPYLNGKHVVFGEIEEGMDALEELGKVNTDSKTSRPIDDVVISSCGEIDASGNDRPSLGICDAKENSSRLEPAVFGGSSSAFGSDGAKGSSIFGKTTAFSLGTSSSATGVFGSTSTNDTSAFGSSSVLGSSSNNTSANRSKGGFGALSISGSTSAAPIFGSPSTLGSGGNATTNKAVPTNSAAVFGSPSTLGIGGGKPSTSVFGSGGASAFGGTGTGSSKATNGFWTLPASESPGDAEPVFGMPSSFGGVGSGSSSNLGGGFGALAASISPPAFGSPSAPKPSIFGGANSAFGSSSNSEKDKPSPFSAFSSSPSKKFSFGAATHIK